MESGQPRRKVWCEYADLVDNADGTYAFVNLPLDALGYGSKVYVIDRTGLTLFYDDNTGILYPWASGSGGVIPPATNITIGGVIVGDGLSVEPNGTLALDLPIASDDVLGGVKVGEGLYVNSNGVLAVSNTGTLYVGKATETMSTSETTKTVNFTGSFITAYATMSGVKISLDITINESSVVFTVGEAPSSAIVCTVIYGEANE